MNFLSYPRPEVVHMAVCLTVRSKASTSAKLQVNPYIRHKGREVVNPLSQPGCAAGLLVPHTCPASKILSDPRISIGQHDRVFGTQAASFVIPNGPLMAPIIEDAGIARRWRFVDTHKVAIPHCNTQIV